MSEERRQDQPRAPWESAPEEQGEYHFTADEIPHDDTASTGSNDTDALYADIDVQAVSVEDATDNAQSQLVMITRTPLNKVIIIRKSKKSAKAPANGK